MRRWQGRKSLPLVAAKAGKSPNDAKVVVLLSFQPTPVIMGPRLRGDDDFECF